jgi:hypothetical protein
MPPGEMFTAIDHGLAGSQIAPGLDSDADFLCSDHLRIDYGRDRKRVDQRLRSHVDSPTGTCQ